MQEIVKVKHLLNALSKLDPEAHVLCHCEDEEAAAPYLVISSVNPADMSPDRHDDGTVTFERKSGAGSRQYAVLEITSDW